MHNSAMLNAQRLHGNRAVQRFTGRLVSVQREESDEEQVAKSVLGDAAEAEKAPDTKETDTLNDKEYIAKMTGPTVEAPKSPDEDQPKPDKEAEERQRREREEQARDDREIYERELRRAQQEKMRDSSVPLNSIDDENFRGRVRDGAFTPLGGQSRLNPWGS